MDSRTTNEVDPRQWAASVASVAELDAPELWHGHVVRSPTQCGSLSAIQWPAGIDDCVRLEAADLGARNRFARGAGEEPVLAEGEAHYVGEPVALLAHPERRIVESIERATTIPCEAGEPIESIEFSLAAFQQLYADDNVFQRFEISAGDVVAAMRGAARIVENKFRVSVPAGLVTEQPSGALAVAAVPHADGRLTLMCDAPTLDLASFVSRCLGLPADDVDCIAVTSQPPAPVTERAAVYAAHLALACRAPVRVLIGEDWVRAVSCYHDGIVRHRSAFDGEGRFVAREIMIFLDGGAYATCSVPTLLRGFLHGAGAYACPNVRVRGRVVATHRPPRGGLPGDGVVQSLIGAEAHMDVAARQLSMGAAALRQVNALADGDRWVTGAALSGMTPARVFEDAMRGAGAASTGSTLVAAVPAWTFGNPLDDFELGDLGRLKPRTDEAIEVVPLAATGATLRWAGLDRVAAAAAQTAMTRELARRGGDATGLDARSVGERTIANAGCVGAILGGAASIALAGGTDAVA